MTITLSANCEPIRAWRGTAPVDKEGMNGCARAVCQPRVTVLVWGQLSQDSCTEGRGGDTAGSVGPQGRLEPKTQVHTLNFGWNVTAPSQPLGVWDLEFLQGRTHQNPRPCVVLWVRWRDGSEQVQKKKDHIGYNSAFMLFIPQRLRPRAHCLL